MQLDLPEVERIVDAALAEDIGKGDITSNALIDSGAKAQLSFVPREDIIICGMPVIYLVFEKINPNIKTFLEL